MAYESCVLDTKGNCSRWNHDHPAVPATAEDPVAQTRRQLLGDALVDDQTSPVASAARSSFRLGWEAAVERLTPTAPVPGGHTPDTVEKARKALEAILIRCREGDKRSDWLPVIDRLAVEALDALSVVPPTPEDGHGPGKCVSVEDANRVLAEERDAHRRTAERVASDAYIDGLGNR